MIKVTGMKTQEHLIKKFAVELQVPAERGSYSLQHKCSELIKDRLLEDLDPLLDNFFEGNDVIQIKKLEIDLGVISGDDFEKLFVEKCLAGISLQLASLTIDQSREQEKIIERFNIREMRINQFLYFLRMGRLPWSAMHPQFDVWQQDVLQAIEEENDFFIEQFHILVDSHPTAIERLRLQFDEPFIERLLYSYHPVPRSGTYKLLRLLRRMEKQFTTSAVFNKLYVNLLKLIIQKRSQDVEDRSDEFHDWLQANVAKHTGPSLPASLDDEIEKLVYDFGSSFLVTDIISAQERASPKKEQRERVILDDEEITERKPDQSVYISNAGLVILHPFFNGLFEELGYTRENEFITDLETRAVHLLQYMVNAGDEVPEYFLVLNKILCGMESDEHINRFIQLADPEKEEALKLLQAVIGHWNVLKNTSAEGLQQAFLQRRGKLVFNKEDGYWKLQVEKAGVDVLMDKLPWSFSYIQLPWMKYPLITEW